MKNYMTKEYTLVYKGMAILMIVLCHSCAAFFSFSVARLTTPLGGIGVSIFLFLSGFGLNESARRKGLEGYWTKKFEKVLYPYLIVFTIYMLLMHESVSARDGFLLFFTLKDRQDYYYWYIGYQFYWYICYYFSQKLNKSDYKIKYVILGLSATLSFGLFNTLRAEQSVAFILGVLVSDFPKVKSKLCKNYINIFLMVLGVGMLTVKQLPIVRNDIILLKVVQLLIKTPLALVVIKIGGEFIQYVNCKKMRDGLAVLGKYSYEVYLAHALAILVVLNKEINLVLVGTFFILTVLGTWLLVIIEKIVGVKREWKKLC